MPSLSVYSVGFTALAVALPSVATVSYAYDPELDRTEHTHPELDRTEHTLINKYGEYELYDHREEYDKPFYFSNNFGLGWDSDTNSMVPGAIEDSHHIRMRTKSNARENYQKGKQQWDVDNNLLSNPPSVKFTWYFAPGYTAQNSDITNEGYLDKTITGMFTNRYLSNVGEGAYIREVNAAFKDYKAGSPIKGVPAILNEKGRIDSIKGDFVADTKAYKDKWGSLKEILEYGTVDRDALIRFAVGVRNVNGYIGTIEANFACNVAGIYGGAILNTWGSLKDDGGFNWEPQDKKRMLDDIKEGIWRIEKISGTFVANGTETEYGGGVVFNNASIKEIEGLFIANKGYGGGGCISNTTLDYAGGVIESIKGEFRENRANGGGVVNNSGGASIGSIEGDFIDNYAYKDGAAISNNTLIDTRPAYSTPPVRSWIGSISGNFYYNQIDNNRDDKDYREDDDGTVPWLACGGAIFNHVGQIGEIDGVFAHNFSASRGGAINSGEMVKLYVDGKYVMYNSQIGSIKGLFYQNQAGVIHKRTDNNDYVEETLDYYKNGYYIYSSHKVNTWAEDARHGGAILNHKGSYVGYISGYFIKNYAEEAGGGVAISGLFYDAIGEGHEITRENPPRVGYIKDSVFEGNRAGMYGGAISNWHGVLGLIDTDYDDKDNPYGDNLTLDRGIEKWEKFVGRVVNDDESIVTSGGALNLKIKSNKAILGGGIFNADYTPPNHEQDVGEPQIYRSAIFKIENCEFEDNKAITKTEAELSVLDWEREEVVRMEIKGKGGAIFNRGSRIGILGRLNEDEGVYENDETLPEDGAKDREYDGTITGGIINSSFKDNHASEAGGAIWSDSNLYLIAQEKESGEHGDMCFQGNTICPEDATESSGIWLETEGAGEYADETPTIYMIAQGDAAVVVDDTISSREWSNVDNASYVLRLRGNTRKDEMHRYTQGSITLNGRVMYSHTILDDVTLTLGMGSGEVKKYEPLFASLREYDQYQYGVSDVMRDSHLETRSGVVSLAEGDINQYLIGELTAYGRSGNHEPDANFRYGSYDVDLTSSYYVDLSIKDARADIITVLEVEDKDGESETSAKHQSTGRVTLHDINVTEVGGYTKDDYVNLTFQVLNIVRVNEAGEEVWSVAEYQKYYGEEAPIELTNDFSIVEYEHAVMYGSDVLAAEVELATTKTHNDSIHLVGWRDNLAAWAEYTCTSPTGIYGDPETESADGHKIFYLDKPMHTLTRDINIPPDGPTPDNWREPGDSALMWGSDLELVGLSLANKLTLERHNLLTQIGEEQKVRLERFTLLNVGNDNNMLNKGTLTIDTMRVENELVVHNEKDLLITGVMSINNTITSAATDNRTMVIDDSSRVTNKRTIIDIDGTVENQNIYHRGEGEVADAAELLSDVETLKDVNFSTVTNLVTTQDKVATAAFSAFQNNELTMEGGKLNLYDMHYEVLHLRGIHMKGGLIYVKSSTVDLEGERMGGIRGELPRGVNNGSYEGGTIWLNDWSIVSDGKGLVTHVKFVTEEVGDAVQDNNLRDKYVYGPKYQYYVTYNDSDPNNVDLHGKLGRNGWYTFVRTLKVNPAVQAGGVTQQAGVVTSTLVYDYAFEHADMFADAIQEARMSDFVKVTPTKGKEGSRIAAEYSPASTGSMNPAGKNGGIWMHPFSTFEHIPLHNGPTVSASIYGGLVGVDSNLMENRSGWMSVASGYLGYTGSDLRWDGNRTHQNGGLIGGTETFYKGNFYVAATASIGVSSGSTNTMYGREQFNAAMGGVAARAGYSYAIKGGKYVLQPSLLVSYTCSYVGDYTNAAGVRVESDPTHVVQIRPFVKLIAHTRNDWKPYLHGGFVWSMGGETRFRADGETLPEMGLRPYAEYGAGLQKTWRNKYTIYGQGTGRSGGRNGVEVSSGIRWHW